jgi:hypothetical protein
MKSRTVVAGFAITLAIAGCATMDRGAGANTCDDPGVCKIDVPLSGCTVSPPLADIDVYGKNRVIQWELQGSPNVTFAAQDGIFLKDDPQHQFGPGQRSAPRKFIMPDKNDIHGDHTHHYGIKLIDGDTPCPLLDPGIINHG